MRKLNFIGLVVLVCGCLALPALAENYQLTDGRTLSGEAVSPDVKGVIIRFEDGKTSDRTAWDKFSQGSLKLLAAKNARTAAFVEPFILPTEEEIAAEVEAKKTTIVIKTDYPKIERPAKLSLLKALSSSGIGLFALFLIYAANVYAGYEISVFRMRPAALGCVVAAVLPILGPVILLCIPTHMEAPEDVNQEPARDKDTFHVAGVESEAITGAEGLTLAHTEEEVAHGIPASQTFERGQFTFNRRFFETKFPGFFTVVKRDDAKNMVLVVAAARGRYNAERVTRVTANEIHLLVQKGHATEEVMIPFTEISEVVLKHKDA